MQQSSRILAVAMAAFTLAAHPALAEPTIAGGVTATYQHVDDGRIDDQGFASADLVAVMDLGGGVLLLYVEGNTTPRAAGVATLLREANADAGSALDSDGDGRVQVSELHYTLPLYGGGLTLGLLDVTAFLDTSETANDETAQFVGASFVNNPAIAFPDYTLGAVYSRESRGAAPGFSLALTGSHGLADNPGASYAHLFDLGESGEGLFAAGEVDWNYRGMTLRAGAWLNTASHARLDTGAGSGENSGVYGVIDGRAEQLKWTLRAGLADSEVSAAARFAALSVEVPSAFATLGAGVARTWLSGAAAASGTGDTGHAEVYARIDIGETLHITPAVQWIMNSGFDASGTAFDDDLLIAGVRAGYSF